MERSDFSVPAVNELLGRPDARLAPPEQQALWAWRARGRDRCAAFTRLFVLGQPIANAEARSLFGADLDRALRGRLLQRQDGHLVAGLSLSVHEGILVFADPARQRPARDHVLGPTRATMVLEGALPPALPEHALEIGTGAGYLALRLAGRGLAVTATDVSRRALELAALNAALADLTSDRIEWLLSDRFVALRRRTFPLVIGNLPFVVSPTQKFVYRDGGMAEDGFVAAVVGAVGRHLVPGGTAIFLGQWIHREGEPEDERLAPWFVAAGCDALVLRLDAEPVDVYAARWSAGPGADPTPAERQRELERWVLHLRRGRIQGISTGLFVLRRRRATRHFMAIDDVAPAAPLPRWGTIADRLAELEAQAG
jgi:methylase of polypeptide subunit release factors